MITVNVKRFIALQIQVDNQINQYGKADAQLTDTLEMVGDQLTGDEVSVIRSCRDEIEWMIG